MSEYNVSLPSKPRIVSEEEFKGTYEIDGLYPGYGHTLGNSLRRIILLNRIPLKKETITIRQIKTPLNKCFFRYLFLFMLVKYFDFFTL